MMSQQVLSKNAKHQKASRGICLLNNLDLQKVGDFFFVCVLANTSISAGRNCFSKIMSQRQHLPDLTYNTKLKFYEVHVAQWDDSSCTDLSVDSHCSLGKASKFIKATFQTLYFRYISSLQNETSLNLMQAFLLSNMHP